MEFTFSNRRWILKEEPEKVSSDFALGLHIAGRYDKILDIAHKLENRDKLTHIIVDDNQDLPMFLQEVYSNEENYEYLKNEFNSKDIGFNHNVKLFKKDFELFDSIIED